jgi:alpha-tubulin suppressor-like RCC1 family protein
VRCWGANDDGQLGDGTFERKPQPTPVHALAGVIGVAAGVHTTCGRTDADLVWCWGDNHAGQLGDGSTHDRDVPVAVRWQLASIDADADAGSE